MQINPVRQVNLPFPVSEYKRKVMVHFYYQQGRQNKSQTPTEHGRDVRNYISAHRALGNERTLTIK